MSWRMGRLAKGGGLGHQNGVYEDLKGVYGHPFPILTRIF